MLIVYNQTIKEVFYVEIVEKLASPIPLCEDLKHFHHFIHSDFHILHI
jgi:hypothetical protein